MNKTTEVQGAVSFIPYRLGLSSEEDAFESILNYYDGDMAKVINGIETTTDRLKRFHKHQYVPPRKK